MGDENISGRQNMQFSKQFLNFSSRVASFVSCVKVYWIGWILRSINSWGLLWDINKLLLTCLLATIGLGSPYQTLKTGDPHINNQTCVGMFVIHGVDEWIHPCPTLLKRNNLEALGCMNILCS